jgi:hypothetical protein
MRHAVAPISWRSSLLTFRLKQLDNRRRNLVLFSGAK